jgi:hypothetical protein
MNEKVYWTIGWSSKSIVYIFSIIYAQYIEYIHTEQAKLASLCVAYINQ